MKPKKGPRQPNKGGRGFISLEQFQLGRSGKMPSEFGKDSLIIGRPTNIPVEKPPEKRRVTFNDLSPVTKVHHPALRNALGPKGIYASRAAKIQHLINLRVISEASIPELINAAKGGNLAFEQAVIKILAQHFGGA